MSKNKSKKKRSGHLNPHKLAENELREKVNEHLVKNQVNDAYTLAKVLLERFESADTIALFQSVLNKKISALESDGKASKAARLIAEAKKRFSATYFREADEFVRLQALDDDQLVDHFSRVESIPELFRYRLADILFLSESKNRPFIKQHPEYKDVFYVKEAFQKGYHPVDTPKFLAGIKTTSPYKPWILLHKAIQAFQQEDRITLELVVKKMPNQSFPEFLASALYRCQRNLDGTEEEFENLSPADLQLFQVLCGDHISVSLLLTKLMSSPKPNPKAQLSTRLQWLEKHYPAWYQDIVFLCLQSEQRKRENRNEDPEVLFSVIEKVSLPIMVALNKTHIYVKINGFNSYEGSQRKKVVDSIINSHQLEQQRLFDANQIRAELLLYYARTLNLPQKRPNSVFERLLGRCGNQHSGESPIPVLERALEFSDHNPEIFTLLIASYRESKEKTSTVNRVIDRLLQTFPTHPEGYELAGRIAFENKSYKKAIGLFETAKRLMPLNKEVIQTILNCFEGIIEKRNQKNAHLIDNDLNSAAGYLENSSPRDSLPYRLLEIKALLKKFTLLKLPVEELEQGIRDLLTMIAENGRMQLKLSLLLFEAAEKNKKLLTIRQLAWDWFINHVTSKTFLLFHRYALVTETYPSQDFELFISQLTLRFLEREKAEKTISAEQFLELMSKVLANHWNRTFFGLVCLARSCHPENKLFSLLECLITSKVDHKKINRLLHDPEVIQELTTPFGKDLLDELSLFNDTFEELCYHIVVHEQTDPNKIIDIVDELEEFLIEDFETISTDLFDEADSRDMLSPKELRKLFGIPVRAQTARVIDRLYCGNGYELIPWQSAASKRKAEKQRQEDEKKWNGEQERKRKERQEAAEKRKRIEEEIEEKNEQLDIFNLLDKEGDRV